MQRQKADALECAAYFILLAISLICLIRVIVN